MTITNPIWPTRFAQRGRDTIEIQPTRKNRLIKTPIASFTLLKLNLLSTNFQHIFSPTYDKSRTLLPIVLVSFHMKNILRTFFKDLIGPRPIFLKKYMLPLLFLFFLWGLFSSVVSFNKSLPDLRKISGKVEDIFKRKEVAGYGRNVYYPLYIKLENNEGLFRIKDSFSSAHNELLLQIEVGDTVHIYIRHEEESKFLWGRTNDVFQLDKETVLFSLDEVSESQYEQIFWNIAFLVCIPIVYILISKKYPNN